MKTMMKLVVGLALAMLAIPAVRADEVTDLKTQVEAMQKQMAILKKQLDQVTAELKKKQKPAPASTTAANAAPAPAAAPAPSAPAPATAPAAAPTTAQGPAGGQVEHSFLEKKKGDPATFYTPGGEISIYANLDVSVDATTKGISGMTDLNGNHPVGRVGWLPAVSTNLSYIGVRGFQDMSEFLDAPLRFVYQLETQIDIAATSGTAESNSNKSNVVKGGLTSRNSFIGLSSPDWGAIKIGKTDAPYKLSTQRLNPFSGMIGDYQVIMGNTGGDNRVEFGTRLDHSIWYESPKFLGGFTANVLWSPGQNRASNSDNIGAGESDCTGGNVPGSGGTITPAIACNDGAFSDAISANIAYENGPLYLTAAYERHFKVNRSSDVPGLFADAPTGAAFAAMDTADEDAWKVAAQYVFPTKTTVGAIFEDMHRYVPSVLDFQNERQRLGTWLVITQQFGERDSVSFGWAHAFRTPGDPGQHNTSINPTPFDPAVPPGGTGGAHADNQADLLTLAWKHIIGRNLTFYADFAATLNHQFAHYDLGAGGRAVTTDCHAGNDPASGGESSSPMCWAGGHLLGVSMGLDYRF